MSQTARSLKSKNSIILIIMSSSCKDDIISKVYYDRSGFGSRSRTLEEAREKDKTITMSDINEFFRKNVEQKRKHVGSNSFVAPHSYEDLLKAVSRQPRNIQGEGKQSHLSLLLRIKSAKPYNKAQVMLIESHVAHLAIREALEKRGREGRQQFINVALEYKELGSFVGFRFQDTVLEGLTAKTDPRTLQFRSVTSGAESGTVEVPPAKQTIELIEKLSKSYKAKNFETNMLYVPESKSFPAADFFFVQKQDDGFVLWFLQTTKGKKHEFKLVSMHEKFKRYFAASDLKRVCAINWVIVAPTEAIAKEYAAEKKPDGQWKEDEKDICPKQYVSCGKWSD